MQTVEFEERDKYLYALISGTEETIDDSYDCWVEIARRSQASGYTKVLIEEDLPTQISVVDLHALAELIPKMGFEGLKLAFVDRHADQFAANQYAEQVATNRGMNGRVFLTVEEAESWLLTSP